MPRNSTTRTRTAHRTGLANRIIFSLLLILLFAGGCSRLAAPVAEHPPLAAPASEFDRLFDRRDGGWTGGDGTLSVPLADGRNVWMFGDSFLGVVTPEGTRPQDVPFIHNCLVVQRGDTLRTLYKIEDGRPAAFFPAPAADDWYWPGDGIVSGPHLEIFLHQFTQSRPELWGWRYIGTRLAVLSLPDMAIEQIKPLSAPAEILYGVCVLEIGNYIYIYGTDERKQPQLAHVARTAAGSLEGPWFYFNGRDWSAQPADSAPVLSGVSTQYAVIQAHQAFYLFTMDAQTPFSNRLVVYRAPLPTGPWQGPLALYDAPETNGHIVAYNPFVHLQFSTADRVLVSYNLNDIVDPGALYRHAGIYRPRFIWIDMAAVAQRFDKPLH